MTFHRILSVLLSGLLLANAATCAKDAFYTRVAALHNSSPHGQNFCSNWLERQAPAKRISSACRCLQHVTKKTRVPPKTVTSTKTLPPRPASTLTVTYNQTVPPPTTVTLTLTDPDTDYMTTTVTETDTLRVTGPTLTSFVTESVKTIFIPRTITSTTTLYMPLPDSSSQTTSTTSSIGTTTSVPSPTLRNGNFNEPGSSNGPPAGWTDNSDTGGTHTQDIVGRVYQDSDGEGLYLWVERFLRARCTPQTDPSPVASL